MDDEKRYQVFVSSTFEDLIEERREVTQALLELDCIPSGMELFPAADNDQWTLIKKVIDDCDYYLMISAGRYGSIGPESISYTEMEYRYALDRRKPIISFIYKDLPKLPLEKSEKDEDARRKLTAFQNFARKKSIKHYVSPQDLGSIVSRSIIKLIKTNPAVGWVRGDKIADTTAYKELADLRKQLDTFRQSGAIPPQGVINVEELLQGHEEFSVTCTIEYADKTTFDTSMFDWDTEVSVSGVFGAIAPSLMTELSSDDLKQKISEYIKKKDWNEIESDQLFKDMDYEDFYVDDQSFDTIRIQLLALGFLQKRKAGSAIRFGLSDVGEKEMYRLRALKRPKKEGPSGGPSTM